MSPARTKAAAARPSATKPSAPKTPSVSAGTGVEHLGLEELKSLIALVAKESIHEFEFETGAVRFRIRKDAGGAAPAVPAGHVVTVPSAASAPVPTQTFLTPGTGSGSGAAALASAPAPAEAEETGIQYVTSPIVGTFYRAPSPTAPPFVQPGDFVRPGQTLCIVEAMKLMNEIECEVSGEVVKVLVENGQPVEYGERIFAIRVS